jgi:hypothetical protein
MRAFVTYLNGRKLCTAGVGADGVLSTILTWTGPVGSPGRSKQGGILGELFLDVGGLVSPADEHVRWRHHRIKVGDEICIKVVESKLVDPPRHRYKRDRTRELREQKAYVRQMARKLGWKVSEVRGSQS